MSLANVDHDQLKDQSMIELAILILEKNKKAFNYKLIFDQVAELKNFSASEKEYYLAQFYTDLNLDGRFLTLGGGEWGLKKWYSVEQIDEIIKTEATPKKRKKKKKKKKVKEEEETSIDDQDEDLTEIPLELVERAHQSKAEDEDDDTLTLSDDNLIDEEDFDDYDEDEDEDDEDLDDDELDEEEEK